MALRSFCVNDAKNVVKKVKTYLQNEPQNRQFSIGRPFTSRGLLIEKSVFLTGRVLRDVGMFLQN